MRFLIGFTSTVSSGDVLDMLAELGLETVNKGGLQLEHVPQQRHLVEFVSPIALGDLQKRVTAINPKITVSEPITAHLTIKTDTWWKWANMEAFRKVHDPRIISYLNDEWVFEAPTTGILNLYSNTLDALGIEGLVQTVAL